MRICVLLASYNGEKFLSKQLVSLQKQTEENWVCLIRDDGSIDKSVEIINSFCEKDSRFILVNDDKGSQGGSMANFSLLAQEGLKTDADYFFFSDQDDVWIPRKLEIISHHLQAYSNTEPVLVFHDLEVVDESMNVLARSFAEMSKFDPHATFSQLLSRNVVTGCALAGNRALFEQSSPVPAEAVMHDWWFALNASYYGQMHFVDQALVRYRQHGKNVLGAKSFWEKVNPVQNIRQASSTAVKQLNTTLNQANAFLVLSQSNHVSYRVDTEKKYRLGLFCDLSNMSKIKRIKILLKNGLLQRHLLLKVISLIKFSLLKKK